MRRYGNPLTQLSHKMTFSHSYTSAAVICVKCRVVSFTDLILPVHFCNNLGASVFAPVFLPFLPTLHTSYHASEIKMEALWPESVTQTPEKCRNCEHAASLQGSSILTRSVHSNGPFLVSNIRSNDILLGPEH